MHLRCWWLSRDHCENSAQSQHDGVLFIYLPSHIYYGDSSERYVRSVISIKHPVWKIEKLVREQFPSSRCVVPRSLDFAIGSLS